jgi:putative peptidoglycan lipid II flippase
MTAATVPVPVAERSLGRIMGGIAPAGFAVQLCSFASSVTFAHVLGATAATDGYYLGLSIPVLAFGLFVGALRQGAIPALTDVDLASGRKAFAAAGGDLLRGVMVAATIVTLVAVGAAEALAPLVAGGRVLHETRVVLLELAPYGVSGAVVGVLGALLAVRGVFALPVLVVSAESVLKIVLLLAFGDKLGVQSLVLGNLGGSAFAIVLLTAVLRRRGVRLGLRGSVDSAFVRSTLALSTPVLISLSVLQVNPVIDRTMAAALGAGKVTALELGLRLYFVSIGLVMGLMLSPITATWSARFAAGGWPALEPSVRAAVRAAAIWVPPVVVIGFAVRRQIIDVLYSGGAYPQSALHDTARVLGMILLCLPAQALVAVFATLFVVHKETKLLMKVGLANVVLNVAFNFALRPALGVAGIALSTSVTFLLLAGVYVWASVRRWGRGVLPVGGYLGRSAMSVLVTAGVAVGLLEVLPSSHSRPTALLAVAAVGAAGMFAHGVVLTVRAK